MISLATLKAMAAAGATIEVAIATLEALEVERTRAMERAKKQRQRDRNRDIGGTSGGQIGTQNDGALFLKEDKDKEKKERKGSPRGKHALPPDWRPGATLTAKGEEEFAKMQDWALANDARKANWDRMWSSWVRRAGGGCETVTNPTPDIGFYAQFGSKEQEAWEAYAKKTGRRGYPRDKRGGWTFPTRWPPDGAINGESDRSESALAQADPLPARA